jgi:8-oxo-dGTP pyrophosphatase MutT (NUDIX family)
VTGGRELHADALAALRDWQAPSEGQERLRREYVDHLERHAEGLSRSCVPDHVTAGALILSADRSRVLLTLHAKARAWFHTGGHCEAADRTLAGAAFREATEESGVPGLRLDPVPLQLDRHEVAFCGGHQRVDHLDVRFLAVAPRGSAHAVSEESLDVRWWPVDALPDTADLPALVRLGLARAEAADAGQAESSASI